MKFQFHLGVALLIGCVITSASAREFDWPGHGTISLDAPEHWRMRGSPAGDTGFNFRGDLDAASAATLQITVVTLPPDKVAPNPAEAKDYLARMVADALPDSVEKKFSPVALNLRQGHGWYAQFTDASLVGKPPTRENLKVMRNGFASLTEHAMAVITMQFDDPDSAAPAEMLRIVESLRFQAVKTNVLQIQRTGEFYDLNVPPATLRLKIPARDLAPALANVGGGTANPRYFSFAGRDSGWAVSGWFEPAARYSDLASF